jgi:hypothetical protein
MRVAEAVLALALSLVGCDARPTPRPFVDDGGASSTVRFKSGPLLERYFAQALDLDPRDFCFELGERRCGDVHAVAIGGVDPYDHTVYQPVELGLASPLIAERMALSACRRRAELDFEDRAAASVFRGSTHDIIESLYVRALQRRPTKDEVEVLEEMVREVEESGEAEVLQTWAVLACVAVTTSREGLFY